MQIRDNYLKGLNALRFFAAFFVIVGHGWRSVELIGLAPAGSWALVQRGETAVDFFFTLSGFLITYLLLVEIEKTGDVNVRFFYFRRIIRIWPVYFAVCLLGIVVLWVVIPRMLPSEPKLTFPLWPFLLFLPNYAVKFYKVGLLAPLWSIGIEEQFYLVWAPLVKWFRAYLRPFLLVMVAFTVGFYLFSTLYLAGKLSDKTLNFLGSMRYYNMAVGALFGYLLFSHAQAYRRSVFATIPMQWLIWGVIGYHYLVGRWPTPPYVQDIASSFFYGLLLLNLTAVSKPVMQLEFKPLAYLGEISYGLYMYHMFVNYGLRFVFVKLGRHVPMALAPLLYLVALIGVSILVASISRMTMEAYFLSLRRLFDPRKAQKLMVTAVAAQHP